MHVKKLFWSVATGVATMLAIPDEASASVGYVCEAHFRHYAPYGQHGYVYVSAYTEPGCTGSWVMGAIYCTTGGTGSLCSAGDLSTAAEIQALIQNLQRAAAARQKVNIVATSGGAGKWVSFFSN
jgi:hypothetical protein